MSRRWRRTTILASALLAVFVAARWGGSWALNRYVEYRFGPEASTFTINPLTLSASSRTGKAIIGSLPVAWREIRVGLWGGKMSAGFITVGDAESPAASVKGIAISNLFGTPVLRVKEIIFDPMNPSWHGLFNQSGPSQSSTFTLPDFALWVEKFSAQTKFGVVDGTIFLGDGQNGARRPFFISFSAGCGATGELQGSWGKEGTVSAKIRFKGGESVINGTLDEGKLCLQGSLLTSIGSWQGDLAGDEHETRCFLLQNSKREKGTGWLYGSYDRPGAGETAISNVRLLSEGIGVPEVILGSGWSLGGIKLHANYFNMDISNKAKTSCLSLSAGGNVRNAEKGVLLPVKANLNWDGGGEKDLLATVAIGDATGTSLEKYLSGLSAAVAVEGFKGAETGLVGSFRRGDCQGWAAGNGTSSQGEAHFGIINPYASGLANLTWTDEGLSCRFGGNVAREKGGEWPLPKGRWSFEGSASWTKGESYPTLDLRGKEAGGAVLEGKFAAGKLEAKGARLALTSSWGAINGAAFSLNGVVGEGGLKNAEIKATAESATLGGGPELAKINCSASLADGHVLGKAASSLPAMDGEFVTDFSAPTGDLSKLRIFSGRMKLLKGDIQLDDVEANGIASWPKPVDVKASKSLLFGAETGPLTGAISEGTGGSVVIAGKTALLGGEADFAVHPGGQGDVEVSGKGFDSSKLAKFVSRWVSLPFSGLSGPVDAAVTIPLQGVPIGINGAVEPRNVTLDLGDERHQFRNAEGKIVFAVAADATNFSSESLTLESGRLPVQIKGKSAEGVVTMEVTIPESDAAEVQNAFFDFLPEYVGFGTMAGRMGAVANLVSDSRDKVLTMNLAFHDAEFASEDKSLSLRGIDGTLPLSISLGLGTLPARKGFKAPDEKSVGSAYGFYGAPLEKGLRLKIRSAAFSVYTMEDMGLSANLTEDGATDIRITQGTLWDGGVRGEFRVGMSSSGLGYSGQLLLNEISLRDLCNQAGGLTGFIGGRLSGHVTFGADKFGLSALKMVAGFAVDPAGDEPMVIGRDFLVKIGGAQMKRLVPTRFLNYDKAQIGFAVRSGYLSVSKLVLEHEANPIKSILRKDISFEIRVPFNNSISIYQLLDSIKGLQERSATVQ